jgi:hypothetical protein
MSLNSLKELLLVGVEASGEDGNDLPNLTPKI